MTAIMKKIIRFFNKFILITVILQIFGIIAVFPQRLSFGVNFQFSGLHYTHFSKDIYFSPSSFKGYYLDQNQYSFTPNYLSYGFVSVIDISRFALWLEADIFSDNEGQLSKLKYPVSDDEYRIYYSRINNGGSRFLVSLHYILSPARIRKHFAAVGFANISPMNYKEDISLQRDFKKGWYNEYELLPVFRFYNNYNIYLLEYGIKNSNYSLSLRYYFRWNRLTPNDNFYSYLTLSISMITNFSGLKKQILYFE